MSRQLTLIGTIAALSYLWTLTATAQQRTGQTQSTQRTTAQAVDQTGPGIIDDKTTGSNVRVSELMGMNIKNDRGDSVGEIHDLVMDASTGEIRYAAVTYGGFLGMGNKLFAVPFDAFRVGRQQGAVTDSYVMILNVTREQLDGAQGFDQDRWPDMANETWAADLDRRYNVDQTRRDRIGRRPGVNVDVDRNGVDVDVNRRQPGTGAIRN